MSTSQPSMLDVNPSARRDDDFYPTPEWMTRALLRRIPLSNWNWSGDRVIEPCCGDGAILRELRGVDVCTNDIVARDPVVPEFLLDARALESWRAFTAGQRLSICVTNPPFEYAFDIAEHAHDHVQIGLILLLRLSWLEPTIERGPWLKAHPPTKLIVMPRHDFRGNGSTDSVTSAWVIWDKAGALGRGGIDFVTRRERDELMRAA